MMAIATLVFHMPRFDVSWWGKLATFLLMFALPGFLLGSSDFPLHDLFELAAWLLAIPGLVISWVTAVAYVPRVRAAIAAGRNDN
jgi:cardiolipin synthase